MTRTNGSAAIVEKKAPPTKMARARKVKPADSMSGPEHLWQEGGKKILFEKFGFDTEAMTYEPMTFKSGNIRYTPDFMHICSNGEVVFIEVKGSRFQKSYAYSRTRARATANANPWFYFYEAICNDGEWEVVEL